MINELTYEQFNATFSNPMTDVAADGPVPRIQLEEYVEECITAHRLLTSWDAIEIHHVYRTGTGEFTHVLFWYGEPNVFLVVVVRNAGPEVYGHHILDFGERYGLTMATQ